MPFKIHEAQRHHIPTKDRVVMLRMPWLPSNFRTEDRYHLQVDLQPRPGHCWRVSFVQTPELSSLAKLRAYNDWSGGVTVTDLGIESLGREGLTNLPDWLARLHKRRRLAFDVANGVIVTSRLQSAQDVIQM
jgi:hypothetical protein